jgi:ribonucleoside-triphosphate reductase (thioredoxin)
MYVNERFELDDYTIDMLRDMEPPFGYNGFGEFIFYRTYSRSIDDKQENWCDVVIRVINGIMSIRKDWYIKNHITWDSKYWKKYSRELAVSMFKMLWSPPGRGLFHCGTQFTFERGSMALYNCSFTNLTNDLGDDISWLMDCLMLGVGVGFNPLRNDNFKFKNPKGSYEYVIPDSREGWCESEKLLIEAYLYGSSKPIFIYDEIRGPGLPIKGFGGLSSGPQPLIEYHKQTEYAINRYMTDKYYDSVLLKTDLSNQAGVAICAGNIRRSAEGCQGSINDKTFLNLKNYEIYPEREAWGWMSNNSVNLEKRKDFEKLGEVAKRVIVRGEPGVKNIKNLCKSRIGKKDKVRKDRGRDFNPCFEIILEHREVCNVDETLPTMCENVEEWYQSCMYATFYASTVSLLPTHQPTTNAVVARNRRIGVSIIDYTGWIENENLSIVTKYLRKGYKIVRKTNKLLNGEAGVPEAIRVTTIKPGGTVPKLVGKTSGAGYPNFTWMIRRVRLQRNHPIVDILKQAGIPYEADYFSKNTDVFEFPLECGPAPPVEEITLWQQSLNLVLLQREWADNSVSNTLMFRPKWKLLKSFSIFEGCNDPSDAARKWIYRNAENHDHEFLLEALCTTDGNSNDEYKLQMKTDDEYEPTEIKIYQFDPKHEEDQIEPVLAAIMPLIKSVSLLPHSPKGAYKQQPEEGISEAEYHRRLASIKPIDWSQLSGSDGVDEKYCQGDLCEISLI